MIRLETHTGWWLITHVEHARLAGRFAEHWGNAMFRTPEPRKHVLAGVSRHDDGWVARDAIARINTLGQPSAFSHELVGKYAAFEEIDLQDYLAVRDRAVRLLALDDAYAAVLVSMHTINLLTDRADRSTIQPQQLPLLDQFLNEQRAFQQSLVSSLLVAADVAHESLSEQALSDHFRLLQACDNLSLLACVDYQGASTLLHDLPCRDDQGRPIGVQRLRQRTFQLDPYPFDKPLLTFAVPARYVEGRAFPSGADLNEKLATSKTELLPITLCNESLAERARAGTQAPASRSRR